MLSKDSIMIPCCPVQDQQKEQTCQHCNFKAIAFEKIPLNSTYAVILYSMLYYGLSTHSTATNYSTLFSLIGHKTT